MNMDVLSVCNDTIAELCLLLIRSAAPRRPVSEEGVGAEVGGDDCGDRCPRSAAEQSGKSRGGL